MPFERRWHTEYFSPQEMSIIFGIQKCNDWVISTERDANNVMHARMAVEWKTSDAKRTAYVIRVCICMCVCVCALMSMKLLTLPLQWIIFQCQFRFFAFSFNFIADLAIEILQYFNMAFVPKTEQKLHYLFEFYFPLISSEWYWCFN